MSINFFNKFCFSCFSSPDESYDLNSFDSFDDSMQEISEEDFNEWIKVRKKSKRNFLDWYVFYKKRKTQSNSSEQTPEIEVNINNGIAAMLYHVQKIFDSNESDESEND